MGEAKRRREMEREILAATPEHARAKLRSKYFKGLIIRSDGRVVHYIVWDGVKDYSNMMPTPEDGALFVGLMKRLCVDKAEPGPLMIVQISSHDFDTRTLDVLSEKAMALIVWAKDHATFKAIVAALERDSERLQ
jgi:hypothetical protein